MSQTVIIEYEINDAPQAHIVTINRALSNDTDQLWEARQAEIVARESQLVYLSDETHS
jgi:hypothetical protein